MKQPIFNGKNIHDFTPLSELNNLTSVRCSSIENLNPDDLIPLTNLTNTHFDFNGFGQDGTGTVDSDIVNVDNFEELIEYIDLTNKKHENW